MIAGQGLHTAAPASVRFARAAGPITFVQDGAVAALGELEVASASRSTTLATRDRRVSIGTVEHVLAALAGLSIHRGLRVIVEGPEMPLADGCAASFVASIAALGVPPTPPELVVTRPGEIVVGESRYVFAPADGVALEVTIDFGDPRIAPHAAWDGSASSFAASIAVARTFGFAREVEALAARGLASHVAPESVIVFTDDAVFSAGRAFSADEPARHKLLDLAGDLFVHGGPPRGRVHAHLPGHAATHEAVRRALASGIVDRLHRSPDDAR